MRRSSFHRLFLSKFPALVSLLALGLILSPFDASRKVIASTFLPDDAEITCRAILPQCFKRSDWAALCARDPSVAVAHPDACRASGFEPGQPPHGR